MESSDYTDDLQEIFIQEKALEKLKAEYALRHAVRKVGDTILYAGIQETIKSIEFNGGLCGENKIVYFLETAHEGTKHWVREDHFTEGETE